MLKIRTGALVALAVAATATAWISVGAARPAQAQTPASTDTVVKVEAPVTPVKKGDLNIPFKVSVENVKNMGGFQFDLTFDANILQYTDVQKGEFLGSTGREVVCNPDPQAGVVRMTCVTLRATPAGVDGGGELATVLFKAKGSGTTDINLGRVKLIAVDENATEIPVTTVTSTSLKVTGGGGFNWMIWGPVIAIAVLVIAGGGAFVVMKRGGGAKSVAAT
jgi:hypothetical protein